MQLMDRPRLAIASISSSFQTANSGVRPDRTSQELSIAYSEVCAVAPGMSFPTASMFGVSAPVSDVCIDNEVLSAGAGFSLI